MSNLVQTLLSIKSPYDSFIDKPELIQGYTEDEIEPWKLGTTFEEIGKGGIDIQ